MPNQNKKTRSRPNALYRIRNWSAYEKTLVQRGSLTFWRSDDFKTTWFYAGSKQRGAQFAYSEQAIVILLTVKEVFHFTNRQVEGFVRSVFELLHLALAVPDHSTLSKRGKTLQVNLPKKARGPLNLVMDSTGMKIYGEGEWKVRTHGKSKRRTWRKLHLGVDAASGEIQAAALTENSIRDDAMAETLLQQIAQPIGKFAADGSYDKRKV
jgi:Transposase DDE domain